MTATSRLQPYARGAPEMLEIPGNAHEKPLAVRQWCGFEKATTLSLLPARRLKKFVLHARSFPEHELVRMTCTSSRKWAVYFCYLPEGGLRAFHRFTISKLKGEGFSVLLVCATPSRADVRNLEKYDVEGLLWKELRGYDFSGYTAGLNAIAEHCGTTDVLVLNDSVLGPFHELSEILESSPWDLTGFTSSYAIENHIQSFCFYIKGLNSRSLRALRSVFPRHISFNAQGPVSLIQETRLARVASGTMSVGSLLQPVRSPQIQYILLGNPKGLVDTGFPFLKRSIFEKYASIFPQDFYRAFLGDLGCSL